MMASERKTRLVSWSAFCVDEKVLPKTASPGTVVKLCDDRGLNNSIADGGPKKPQKTKADFKSAVEKSVLSGKATTYCLGEQRRSR